MFPWSESKLEISEKLHYTNPTHFPLFLFSFVSYNHISAYSLSKRLSNVTLEKARVSVLSQILIGFVSQPLHADVYHFHLR